MKKLLLAILIFFSLLTYGQQKAVVSQYMYNGLLLNPAYAGNQNQLTVTGLYRKQWVNFDGAPSTSTLSAHTSIKKKRVGVGLTVTHDEIGVHSDIGVYSAYAYKISLGPGVLAFGLQGGFNKLTSGLADVNVPQGNDIVFSSYTNKFNPNFGTGLFYSTSSSYIGFSVPYILENSIIRTGGTASDGRESRYYFLTAGKVLDVNKAVKFKPSGLLRYQGGSPLGFDLSANLFLDEVLNIGISYRSADAISAMFSIILNNNLIFGYAYDYTLSDIMNYSSGSHEFMITYHIDLYHEPCHTYF